MLPDISELVLREWFAEELNCTKLKKKMELRVKKLALPIRTKRKRTVSSELKIIFLHKRLNRQFK